MNPSISAFSALLVASALLLGTAASVNAAGTKVWLHGGTNNSATYSVTVDGATAITWKDTQMKEAVRDYVSGAATALQANLNSISGVGRNAILFGFEATGIPANATIVNATLHLTSAGSAGTVVNTWQIRGVAAADTGWVEDQATFNKPLTSAANWSGGTTFDSSLGDVYGTFTESNPSNGTQYSINVTSAFQAIISGTSGGIALLNYNYVSTGLGTAERITCHSDEATTSTLRPGLFVEYLTASQVMDNAIAAAGLAGPNAALDATPHNDGVVNLIKYAFNMNLSGPDSRTMTAGGSSGLPAITSQPNGATSVFRFEFVKLKSSSLTYIPQKCSNLGTPNDWVPLTVTDTPTISSINAIWERVIYEEPYNAATTPRCFGRVQVAVVP